MRSEVMMEKIDDIGMATSGRQLVGCKEELLSRSESRSGITLDLIPSCFEHVSVARSDTHVMAHQMVSGLLQRLGVAYFRSSRHCTPRHWAP